MNEDIYSDNEDKGYKILHKPKAKRHTTLIPKKLFPSWILLPYTTIEFLSNLIIWGCLANTTPMYPYFSISYLIAGSSLDESNAFIHLYWQGVQLIIFSTESYKVEKNSNKRFVSGRSQCLHPSISMRSSTDNFLASSVYINICPSKVKSWFCHCQEYKALVIRPSSQDIWKVIATRETVKIKGTKFSLANTKD